MKNYRYGILIAALAIFAGCNSDDANVKNEPVTHTTKDSSRTEPSVVQDKETAATAELCSCVNSFLAGMNPKIQQILIAAGKSENPMGIFISELQKVSNKEEQEQIFIEIRKFDDDQKIQQCSEGVMKKYNLKENDQASQQKILQAAGQNKNCEMVTGLLKISLQQEMQRQNAQ